MNPQLINIIDRFLKGEFNDNILAKRIYSMLEGKSEGDKINTLINMLQSNGFDINEKIFSEEDLKRWGIPIPQK